MLILGEIFGFGLLITGKYKKTKIKQNKWFDLLKNNATQIHFDSVIYGSRFSFDGAVI